MTARGVTVAEFADRCRVVHPSQQLGKTELARWEARAAPWARDILATVMAPDVTHLRTKRLGDGDDRRGWYQRAFGEPFSDEDITIVKPSCCGLTEIMMSRALEAYDRLNRFRAAKHWWRIDDHALDAGPMVIGVDWAADRVEWDVADWGSDSWRTCNPAPTIDLTPPARMTRRDLLATSANVDINKVKSVRSTKPVNQVIRSLVVQKRAPLPNIVRKRGHGPA
ncbi:hypothetical protein [Caulobacter sp. Root343]|uniref:hypothetical protein n=1 Tax=Caulobacter sp. Root343 TaxID=1736520 RepID=UPI0006FDD080|nr:hypothetical protein [Caulobacter sp. Root343]KQV66628.1 hypothetical protein ASC70_12405 [Caulobacter sp. Root343]